MTPRFRTLTIIAVGLLVLDGVLLGLAGVWSGRWGLIMGAVVSLLVAGGVLYLWKRYNRTLADLAVTRRELRAEALALRQLIRENQEKD